MTETTLDSFEQSIEDGADDYTSLKGEKLAKVENLLDGVRKSKNINIRISEYDLERLKDISLREGLPYQTLISSILHKFITKQLVDEQAILQSLKLMNRLHS